MKASLEQRDELFITKLVDIHEMRHTSTIVLQCDTRVTYRIIATLKQTTVGSYERPFKRQCYYFQSNNSAPPCETLHRTTAEF